MILIVSYRIQFRNYINSLKLENIMSIVILYQSNVKMCQVSWHEIEILMKLHLYLIFLIITQVLLFDSMKWYSIHLKAHILMMFNVESCSALWDTDIDICLRKWYQELNLAWIICIIAVYPLCLRHLYYISHY